MRRSLIPRPCPPAARHLGCPQHRTLRFRTGFRTSHRALARSALVALSLLALALTVGAGSATAETPEAPGGGDAPSPSTDVATRSRWLWPLGGRGSIIREFEAPPHPYGAGHRGIDITATPGQTVRAPATGTVSFAGVVVDRGVLSIAHPGGLVSSFEPVEALLVEGEVVNAGEAIATSGGTSHCASSCLHLGVRRDGEYISPLLLLGGIERAVLLPVVPAR